MSTKRIQQQVARMLGTVEAAIEQSDWHCARRIAQDVLALDPENADAHAYLEAVDRRLERDELMSGPPPGRPWTTAEEDELRLLAGRHRATDIARRLNRSIAAIYKRAELMRLSLRYDGPPRRSQRSPRLGRTRP